MVKHLKWWTGLAKSANISCSHLFLPKSMAGFQLPLLSTTYIELQCAKAASLMSSRDLLVHHLASHNPLRHQPWGRASSHTSRWSKCWKKIMGLAKRQRVRWCRQTCRFTLNSAGAGLCKDRLQNGGRSGEDHPPSVAPNLVQEQLERIALALNSYKYSIIAVAWLPYPYFHFHNLIIIIVSFSCSTICILRLQAYTVNVFEEHI